MMYKSQFHKIDPYDWFCAPGSHLFIYLFILCFKNDYFFMIEFFHKCPESLERITSYTLKLERNRQTNILL